MSLALLVLQLFTMFFDGTSKVCEQPVLTARNVQLYTLINYITVTYY